MCKTAANLIDADGLLDIQALWISRSGVSSRDRKVTGDYDHMQPVYRRAYRQESALIKAALDATRVSVDDEVVRCGDHIEGLVEAWGGGRRWTNPTSC